MQNVDFLVLAEALAIGLLIGVERYKGRRENEVKSAGMRTFAIIALLGGLCALLEQPLLAVVTFVMMVGLLAIGYWRQSAQSLGLTTEISAMLAFWMGYLVRHHERLMISTAIVVVVVLASKRSLHHFVRGKVTDTEFYDTVKFLVVVFVVLPLLPDQEMGYRGFFNPYRAWILVIVVSTLSYIGYILIRVFGSKRGVGISALVGGLVSTTAVTVALAQQSRQNPSHSRLYGVTAVLANSVQFPRLLVLIWIVFPELGALMSLPLAGMFVSGLLGAWIIGRRGEWRSKELDAPLSNPYSFLPALKFAALFVVVLFVARVGVAEFGSNGVFLASGLSGLADASAISLSLASMANTEAISLPVAAWSILIAVTCNALVKWLLALMNGSRDVAFWLGGGLLTMLVSGTAILMALGVW